MALRQAAETWDGARGLGPAPHSGADDGVELGCPASAWPGPKESLVTPRSLLRTPSSNHGPPTDLGSSLAALNTWLYFPFLLMALYSRSS